jgi:hypothetical protein
LAPFNKIIHEQEIHHHYSTGRMSHASIFQVGCRDTSNKESRVLDEKNRLLLLRKKNPSVSVLNKRGQAGTAPVKKQATSTHKYSSLPPGYLHGKLVALRILGRMELGACSHKPDHVNSATKLIYGDANGGIQVV